MGRTFSPLLGPGTEIRVESQHRMTDIHAQYLSTGRPCLLSGVRDLPSIFGEPRSVDALKEASERIMCQERLFNMREGITRKDDYYRAVGYDQSTGNPPDSLLAKLGIEK